MLVEKVISFKGVELDKMAVEEKGVIEAVLFVDESTEEGERCFIGESGSKQHHCEMLLYGMLPFLHEAKILSTSSN